jgi:hypothetical protein
MKTKQKKTNKNAVKTRRTKHSGDIAQVAADGSLVLAGRLPGREGLTRVEFDAKRGLYSLLSIGPGLAWQETTLRIARAKKKPIHLLLMRSAQALADGGVQCRSLLRSSAKRKIGRDLQMTPSGARTWRYKDQFADGTHINGDGTYSDRVRLKRQGYDAKDHLLWESESETEWKAVTRVQPRYGSLKTATALTKIRTTKRNGLVTHGRRSRRLRSARKNVCRRP